MCCNASLILLRACMGRLRSLVRRLSRLIISLLLLSICSPSSGPGNATRSYPSGTRYDFIRRHDYFGNHFSGQTLLQKIILAVTHPAKFPVTRFLPDKILSSKNSTNNPRSASPVRGKCSDLKEYSVALHKVNAIRCGSIAAGLFVLLQCLGREFCEF